MDAINWIAALADLGRIVADGIARNWVGVAADLAQLLVDLGLQPTPAAMGAVSTALSRTDLDKIVRQVNPQSPCGCP